MALMYQLRVREGTFEQASQTVAGHREPGRFNLAAGKANNKLTDSPSSENLQEYLL